MKIIDINNRERECLRVFLDPQWPGYVSVEFKRTSDPTKTRVEWMPLPDFATKNPSLSKIWQGKSTRSTPEIAGIVTSSDPESLTDDTANWIENTYAGFFVWISRGPGEGQTRTIMRNTYNQIFIDKPWNKMPNSDSQYSIVQKLGNTTPQGNTLPIVELRHQEEFARQKDIEMGREPAPRQYTKEKNSNKN